MKHFPRATIDFFQEWGGGGHNYAFNELCHPRILLLLRNSEAKFCVLHLGLSLQNLIAAWFPRVPVAKEIQCKQALLKIGLDNSQPTRTLRRHSVLQSFSLKPGAKFYQAFSVNHFEVCALECIILSIHIRQNPYSPWQWTERLHPPKFVCLNPNPQCDGF